jgi:hypothetical protein
MVDWSKELGLPSDEEMRRSAYGASFRDETPSELEDSIQLIREGHYKDARDLLFMIRTDSNKAEAKRLCLLAQAYHLEGNLERALALAQNAVETSPNEPVYTNYYSGLLFRKDPRMWDKWQRKTNKNQQKPGRLKYAAMIIAGALAIGAAAATAWLAWKDSERQQPTRYEIRD